MELIRKNMQDPHSMMKLKREAKSVKHNQSMASPTNKGLSTEFTSQQTKKRNFSKAKPLDEKRYSYHPTPKESKPFTKIDYLTQARISKEEKGENSSLFSIDQWQNEIMKANLTEAEKIEYVKLKSAKMEEELKWKEAVMNAHSNTTINEKKHLDGILLDSIKTKLDLLGEIS